MEIKEKIMKRLLIYLVVTLTTISFLFCSKTDCNQFYIGKFGKNEDPEKIDKHNVSHLKDNLYKIGNELYFGINYKEKIYDKKNDAIVTKCKGIFLSNDIKEIDSSTYKFIVQNFIAKDKNQIYFFPENYEIPSAFILKLDPDKYTILDSKNTYIKDNKYVFCIPENSYLNVDANKFQVIELEEIVLGTDGIYFYEYTDKISIDKFFTGYDFINREIKDSLINKYIIK